MQKAKDESVKASEMEDVGFSPLDMYPVGIELTTTDTAFNPMKVWGGTWTVTPAGAKRVWKRTA